MACLNSLVISRWCPLTQPTQNRPLSACPTRPNLASLKCPQGRLSVLSPTRRSPNFTPTQHRIATHPQAASLGHLAEIADLPALGLGEFASIAAVLAISFVAYRAAVYARIQYITAALIGNQCPQESAQVLEIGVGGGKNLYYYPKGVQCIIGVDPSPDEQLMMQSAAQAGVYLDFRKTSAEQLDIPSNSVDAAVSTYTLGCLTLAQREVVLKEVARVLKPGAPFLYVEMLRGACKGTLELIEGCAEFTDVSYDPGWATMFNDPHAIGVAKKRGMSTQQATRQNNQEDKAIEDLENKLSRKRGSRGKR